jgi:ABC-type nitrate/sulfonate/bicarbonate transport system substrate-binding protein
MAQQQSKKRKVKCAVALTLFLVTLLLWTTRFIYVQSVPAILTAVVSGRAAGGALSAPTTSKAQEAGLNMLVDIAKANVPGLPLAYGVTEKYLKENPNTIYAFLKGIAEGVARTKSDPAAAKRAIGKFTQTDDPKEIDETYEFYAPYWVTSLALRPEQFQTWFSYLDDKEYPLAKKAEPKAFYDNSFVENVEKSGFFQKIGQAGHTIIIPLPYDKRQRNRLTL